MVLSWALQASRQLEDDWKLRSRFVLAALRERAISQRLSSLSPATPLGRLVAEWPQTVGNLIWPYQCARWDAKRRFARLGGHLDAIEEIPGLQLGPEDKLVIADLSRFSAGLSVILDRPQWLSREGHLTLSLFKDEFRAFSISFSLFRDGALEMFIGGIQGRQDDNILDLYRALTKELHGVRPRDFMLEMLRLFARSIRVEHLYAVSDDHKISTHAFFRKQGVGASYDQVWEERGGIKVADTHYELPLDGNRRELGEVAAKKRSMYRQRYEMLDEIRDALPRDLTSAERRRFEAS